MAPVRRLTCFRDVEDEASAQGAPCERHETRVRLPCSRAHALPAGGRLTPQGRRAGKQTVSMQGYSRGCLGVLQALRGDHLTLCGRSGQGRLSSSSSSGWPSDILLPAIFTWISRLRSKGTGGHEGVVCFHPKEAAWSDSQWACAPPSHFPCSCSCPPRMIRGP